MNSNKNYKISVYKNNTFIKDVIIKIKCVDDIEAILNESKYFTFEVNECTDKDLKLRGLYGIYFNKFLNLDNQLRDLLLLKWFKLDRKYFNNDCKLSILSNNILLEDNCFIIEVAKCCNLAHLLNHDIMISKNINLILKRKDNE